MTQPISLTLVLRIETPNEPGAFGMLANVIGDAGGAISAVDMHTVARSRVVRDVTIGVASDTVADEVRKAVEAIDGARIIFAADSTFLAHIGGKIRIEPKIAIKTRQDLSTVYTPGVARVSMAIAADPSKAFQLTIKRNTVAIVTDGTAVLGLGDIGPLGALPVMEGKAMLFKQFADIDAFPICLDTKNVDEIVETVVRIAPVFGGINLEDISAPRCFEIENRLIEALDIPVMHDDQHGTAVVILAALINSARVVGKRLEDLQVVVSGSGAAGTATIKMLLGAGVRDVIPVDRSGALNRTDRYENPHWRWLAEHCNLENRRGSLREVLAGHLTTRAYCEHGARSNRLRDGQPKSGDHARRRGSGGGGHCDRALRFPQSSKQSAGLSGNLSGCSRRSSRAHHRTNEARCRLCDRRDRYRGRAQPRVRDS
jgi:malate dehydrogenase (oxaloacetate-decarboxylating)